MKHICPYCNKPTTATEPHIHDEEMDISLGEHSDLGHVHLLVTAVSCPDEECKKLYFAAKLANKSWMQGTRRYRYTVLNEWQLLPESNAKVLPDYIPLPIQEDYYEACRIRDLSPKASATLARRCLQGMIRDFHGISKQTLFEEIKELEKVVDTDVWESIDAVREVGNIGAHMKKDINIIVDVEADEAQLLIGLIEQLIEDWYVARNDRQARATKLKALAASKKVVKTDSGENTQE